MLFSTKGEAEVYGKFFAWGACSLSVLRLKVVAKRGTTMY